MILFYTNSAKHFADKIKTRKGKFILKKFSDGEIYVKIEENVRGKTVWVLGSTPPPADNLMELIFLIDALKREKAKINLLIPYFGYARQDRIEIGEAFTSKIICNWLKQFSLTKVIVINMHSQRLESFLSYQNIIPLDLYLSIMKKMDVVVAPDKGALNQARKISKECKINLAYIEKFRPTHEKAKVIKLVGGVKNKKVILIDDMISTGGTIIAASEKLKKEGAKEISVIATHGIFAADSIKKIEQSPIKNVYVTNSLLQIKKSKNIKVIDLSKLIEEIIKKK